MTRSRVVCKDTAKFLVTGAAGFIGSHTVDSLLAHGYRVVGVDNSTVRLANLKCARSSPRFELVEADICDEVAMRQLFHRHRFTGILHLAALVSVPESFKVPALNYRINLAAVDRLARLCIEYGCSRIVFASSAAVYGNSAQLPNRETDDLCPLSPYAAAKLASEVMLLGYAESYGLEVVCFRYFNVYGSRQDPSSPYSGVLSIFTHQFQTGKVVTVYGDGEQTRDFVAVDDVVGANINALIVNEVVSGRYNVCTGRAISLNQVLEIYREAYPSAPPAHYTEMRIGDIRHSRGHPGQLKNVLGFEARTRFEDGLRALLRSGDVCCLSNSA